MSKIQDVNNGTSNASNKSGAQNDTQDSEKSFLYTWVLGNFLVHMKFSDADILSQEFEFAGAKWRLRLQANCKNDKLDKIKIRLVKSEKNDSEYYIKCKFSLVDAIGTSVTREAVSSFVDKAVNGHRSSFKCHQENKNGSPLILNDKLTLNCEFLVVSSSVANQATSSDDDSDQLHINRNAPVISATGIFNWLIFQLFPMPMYEKYETVLSSELPLRPKRITHRERVEGILPDLLIIAVILFCITFIILESCDYSITAKPPVNMTEVNELILDSTLKIRSIAEALNLTDVKKKSLELLALYENF